MAATDMQEVEAYSIHEAMRGGICLVGTQYYYGVAHALQTDSINGVLYDKDKRPAYVRAVDGRMYKLGIPARTREFKTLKAAFPITDKKMPNMAPVVGSNISDDDL